MTAWLVDTFVYTSILIALVLVVRRPVARQFGPQLAYALWALPLIRFMMPPLVLPAWMAPAEQTATALAEPMMLVVSDQRADPLANGGPAPEVAIGVLDLLLPLWLAGAALFLIWRVRSYFTMRRELLTDARPVGDVSAIRMVETPAVTSPVAFGVLDKVVALPPAFMAHPDRAMRDMAIAHELAHHKGRDLLANIAAQPLLALHWFNPLAWAGWRAMRRDQEAACDMRVTAGCDRAHRAAYAQVIAEFASADRRLSLAAPMACPVLGEKSIIHRLRSLTRDEPSAGKRRIGLASVSLAALALPFTASISYAAPESPRAPAPPSAPATPEAWGAVPLAPQPPAPENFADVPLPPEPPLPPEALAHPDFHEDPDHAPWQFEDRMEKRMERQHELEEAQFEAELEAMEQEFEAMEHELEALAYRDETVAVSMAGPGRALAHAGPAIARAHDMSRNVRVEMRCEGDAPVVRRELGGGRTAILICNSALSERATHGLRTARQQIAQDKRLPRETRKRIIRQLDAEIGRLSQKQISYDAGRAADPRQLRTDASVNLMQIAESIPADCADETLV